MTHLEAVVRVEPDCLDCRVQLGNAFRNTGRLNEAIVHLEKAKELDPGHAWARYSLGFARQLQDDNDGAIEEYREAVRLDPEDVEAWMSLGTALIGTGACAEAIPALERAAQQATMWAELMSRVAWGLVTCREQGPEILGRAVTYARRAAELTSFTDPDILDTLATALAASGHAAEAKLTWRNALVLAERSGNIRLTVSLRQKLASLDSSP